MNVWLKWHREGDILSLMQRSNALNTPADWLVRAKHNRKLSPDEKLWDSALLSQRSSARN